MADQSRNQGKGQNQGQDVSQSQPLSQNQDIFNYCPRCSEPAGLDGGSRRIICPHCDFKLYLNTAAAVAGLLFDPYGRLMVVRRSRDPRKGFLDLPGGFVDFGEDAEGALRRELREELGLELAAGSKGAEYFRSIPNIYMYGDVLYHTLDLFFICRTEKGFPLPSVSSLELNDEIAEILYKFPKDISEDEIAFDSMKNLIFNIKDRI
jgi:8-oxo-dGTP pyrophosphatase MutT (NUDIX family)